jgi:hypothetical protein
MYFTLSSDKRKFVITFERKQDVRNFLDRTNTADWLMDYQSTEYNIWYDRFIDELIGIL